MDTPQQQEKASHEHHEQHQGPRDWKQELRILRVFLNDKLEKQAQSDAIDDE